MIVGSSEYSGIHQWMRKNFGKADMCEHPDCPHTSKRFVWAKLKGKRYEKRRENFWMLCNSCHYRYDWVEGTREKMKQSHLGKVAWNRGKKLSETHRASIVKNLMPGWNKGKTKEEYPNLANSGVKKGNIPWNKGRSSVLIH
jgi:hypothetical protein